MSGAVIGTPAPGQCPFCGSPDTGLGTTFALEGLSHYIMCRRCGAEGPHRGGIVRSEAEAITTWNGRSDSVSRDFVLELLGYLTGAIPELHAFESGKMIALLEEFERRHPR